MVPGTPRAGLRPAAGAEELRARPVDARGLTRTAAALAAEILRRGERLRIRARGASMLPFVRDRDIVDVDPSLRARVRPGDLVCCEREPGVLHVHRVVDSRADAVLVRGDALAHGQWVDPADVLGVIVAIQRHGRARLEPGGAGQGRLALHVAPLLRPLVDAVFCARAAARRARAGMRFLASRVPGDGRQRAR